MSKKFIPNGDSDFGMMAANFARQICQDPGRFDVTPEDAAELDAAVQRFRAALQACRSGARSAAATRAKEDARADAEQVVRRIGHHLRLSRRIDSAAKVLLGIRERTARPKATPCPQEPPRLRFVRALHGGGASPMHELQFGSYDMTKSRPEGAVRLELFVELVGPDEPIPAHPGAGHGGRPWYWRSYTRSPIVLAPPMPRVPMRVLYWGRWADSAGAVGPFSATCAAWIEGGAHAHLPGGMVMQWGKEQPKLIDPPKLPEARDERYRLAVLEVHYHALHPTALPAELEGPTAGAMRQLEGE